MKKVLCYNQYHSISKAKNQHGVLTDGIAQSSWKDPSRHALPFLLQPFTAWSPLGICILVIRSLFHRSIQMKMGLPTSQLMCAAEFSITGSLRKPTSQLINYHSSAWRHTGFHLKQPVMYFMHKSLWQEMQHAGHNTCRIYYVSALILYCLQSFLLSSLNISWI